jgi:hypothetical protein
MFTFGQVPTYQSDKNFNLEVSPDKRALTLTFNDLQVTLGNDKSAAPMSIRMFSLALPLQGDKGRAEIEFIIQGFSSNLAGATATMVCSVNGQTTVADFPGPSDDSLRQTLTFAADTPSECRICVFLVVGRDAKHPEAAAFLNVASIDAEILPRPPQPA